MGKGVVKEFGINMFTLLYLKWITNKDLLYSTWNSAQCYGQPGWEGSLGRMNTWACMAESLHSPLETITRLLIGYVAV